MTVKESTQGPRAEVSVVPEGPLMVFCSKSNLSQHTSETLMHCLVNIRNGKR